MSYRPHLKERPKRAAPDAPAVRRRKRGLRRMSGRISWRLVSLILILVQVGLGVFIATNRMFYINSAEIGGPRYMPIEEIFTESKIAGKHILQVDPEEVDALIEASPSVDSADVVIQWPARVIIQVREREPALIWEQAGRSYWVDLNGHLMVKRRDIPNLLSVVNEGEAIPFQCPGPACADQDAITINPEVVRGAHHLKTLRANIDVLYYDPVRGLSYQDGRGWRGYFGVGTDMHIKLVIYETLIARLEVSGVHPIYIDVSNPDAPYYRSAQ